MSNFYYNYIGFLALVRKELVRILRIWPQTILPPIITSALYFMIFGHVLGSHIGKMGGVSYLHFIVPGLVMFAVINNSYINVSTSFFGAKFSGAIEEILVSPLVSPVVLLSYLCSGLLRAAIVSVLIVGVAEFFVDVHIYHIFLTLLIVLMCSMIFSAAGFLNGVFANSFDSVSIVPSFILTPLVYLGGVFYQVSQLPSSWHAVLRFNPIYYMIDSFRQVMLYKKIDITTDLIVFACLLFVLLGTCLWAYTGSKRLRS
jgi:ABC-2 type transport system permease protein